MRRAVDAKDRLTRRKSIMEAARMLFSKGDGALPTAAEVALAAGLAKGTVYLYFKTKEEIFANVLLEGWLPLLASAQTIFRSSETRSNLQQARAFIKATVRHLEKKPELMRLDALGAGVLEKNMTPEALQKYKHSFHQGLSDAGSQIELALRLESGRGVQLLMRTYALARGLWQTAIHYEVLAESGIDSYRGQPSLPFSKDLAEALDEYWRGALSQPPVRPRSAFRAVPEAASAET